MACWNDVQESYGICACSTLGRLTAKGLLVSCEADVYGALSMLVQYRAALESTVPHLVDWTIQHQELENVFLPGIAATLRSAWQQTPITRRA